MHDLFFISFKGVTPMLDAYNLRLAQLVLAADPGMHVLTWEYMENDICDWMIGYLIIEY